MRRSGATSQHRGPGPLASWSFILVILAWLAADFAPRFFMGDSQSYLFTGEGWIPPDRSWAYGFAVNFLLRLCRGYAGIILVQAAILAAMIAAARPFYAGAPPAAFAALALLLAADPLLELYVRFVMSDLAAATMFAAALAGLLGALQGGRPMASAALGAAASVAVIFVRTAYLPIIEVTLLLTTLFSAGRLERRRLAALGLMALGPLLGAVALAGANRLVFADRLPGETFLLRPSGVFSAGVYAPALRPADFAAAGIAVTPAEYAALRLDDYDRRDAQIFTLTHDHLHQLIKDKLGITASYTAAVDRTARAIVLNALERDPLAFATVWLHGALLYADPRQWGWFAPAELGVNSDLPAGFVAFSDQRTARPLDPASSRRHTPLLRLYLAVVRLYPLQLLLGMGAAALLLVRQGRRPPVLVLTAALIADLVFAPVFGTNAIARYLLGGVFASYLLIGLAAVELAGFGRREARPSVRGSSVDLVRPPITR